MNVETRVRASFFEQADYCEKLGSPFMRDVLRLLGHHLDRTTLTGKSVLEWPGDPAPKSDALALRLAGGLHALAKSGRADELADIYADTGKSSEFEIKAIVLDAISAFDAEIASWLKYPPQTNEVARSAILYAGLCVIADRFDLPLALHEIGCSGGLNLQCAQFGYSFGGAAFGQTGSSLQLVPDWSGGLPPKVNVTVSARNGCDLNPLSVSEADDAARLISYVWADQPERIARVEAALAISRNSPPQLDRADAAFWVEKRFEADQGMGQVRVLCHTIAWNYFPKDVKTRILSHLEKVGAGASAENPLAWLSFEFDGEDGGPFLRLRAWPGNAEFETLAEADSHANSIKWN